MTTKDTQLHITQKKYQKQNKFTTSMIKNYLQLLKYSNNGNNTAKNF